MCSIILQQIAVSRRDGPVVGCIGSIILFVDRGNIGRKPVTRKNSRIH